MVLQATPGGAEPRTLCGHCGIVAPRAGGQCRECGQALAPAIAPALVGDIYCVGVKCSFQCKSCAFAAPLDHLDVDGSVECAHCGMRQRFDVESWRDALAFVQEVGDLAGPNPEGRRAHTSVWIGGDNPRSDIGVGTTFADYKQDGVDVVDGLTLPRTLQVQAAPGHPPCRKCRVPLSVSVRAPGVVETSCPRCGDTGTYTTPAGARPLAVGLVAVIADEHRSDRPRAREAASGAGVQALSCPSCGGPLKLEAHDRVATCEYCHTPCLIPARALLREGESPRPALWWQLWTGTSAKRTALESGDVSTFTVPQWGKDMGGGFLVPGGRKIPPIGESPGVYEAPEVTGPNFVQHAVTLGVALVALTIGYIVAGH